MERLETLSHALRFIETHLQEPLAPEDVADSCGYSLSALQKLFRYAFHIGVKDYIARRRITSAARELLTTQDTVLAIALRYGYDSHEVFTRAFRRIWGETPSGFRRERRFCDIYPKLNPLFNREKLERGGYVTVQQFENTLLYDAMQTMHGTWAVALDTRRLQEINETYGRPAGDLVIAECIRRIDSLRGESMLFSAPVGMNSSCSPAAEKRRWRGGQRSALRPQMGSPSALAGQRFPSPGAMRSPG